MKRFFTFLGILAVVPFFMSRRSRVIRSIWINVKPPAVFPFLNTLKNWPLWTEWSRREQGDHRYEGPEAGEGAIQHWSSPRMDGTMKIIGSVPDQRVAYALDIQGGRHHLEGVLTLEPVGEGTCVTWACWWVGSENPYTRYFDLAMRVMIGRDFGLGLKNLKELTEKALQPEAV